MGRLPQTNIDMPQRKTFYGLFAFSLELPAAQTGSFSILAIRSRILEALFPLNLCSIKLLVSTKGKKIHIKLIELNSI